MLRGWRCAVRSRQLSLAALAAAAGCGGPAARTSGGWKFPEPDGDRPRVVFTGTVTSVEMLGKRPLTVIPVHFAGFTGAPRLPDGTEWGPRPELGFGVTVEVNSVLEGEASFAAGREAVFAIHSPAQLFHSGRDDPAGGRFEFALYLGKPHPFRIHGGAEQTSGAGTTSCCGMVAEPADSAREPDRRGPGSRERSPRRGRASSEAPTGGLRQGGESK